MRAILSQVSLASLTGLTTLLLGGCSSPETGVPRHVVAIESDGTLRTLENQKEIPTNHVSKGRLTKTRAPKHETDREVYQKRNQEHFGYMFHGNHALDTNETILVFIHGGLNTLPAGVARADRLTEAIMKDPAHPAYPIFIAWDANLFSAWAEQFTTHRGQSDTGMGIMLSPFTALANLGRMLARLPLSVIEQGYAGARAWRAGAYGKGTNEPCCIPRPEQVNHQCETLRSKGWDVQFEPGRETCAFKGRGSLMMLACLPKSPIEGAVDTGGKIGWDFMLRRTRTMFTLSNPGFDRGAMDFFCEELANYMHTNLNKRLVLVGHSMGSIVANEMIRRYGERLHISDIVYMGAACGVNEFEQTVISHLLRHPETSFYNLSLHPGNDNSEMPSPWLIPISPRGSLLDWVDYYYSSADTDYGWTLGKWDNAVLGSSRFLLQQSPKAQERLKKQVHFKSFGYGPESQEGPQHHGGFDQWKFWNPDFWKPGPYQKDWYYGSN